jgi:hypothetical protein
VAAFWEQHIPDRIIGVGWDSGILALRITADGSIPGTGAGSFQVPASGAPFEIADLTVINALQNPGAQPVAILDPITSAMLSAYNLFTVPDGLYTRRTNPSFSAFQDAIIPIAKLPIAGTEFQLVLACPGYGNQFSITSKQTVYVPWRTDAGADYPGLAFPGPDVDTWGNVYPIRAFGINNNAQATLSVLGSPDPSTQFLFSSGWGCYTTQTASDQQAAALNSFTGGTYETHPWEFWFTEWADASVTIVARTFRLKDIKGQKFTSFINAVPYISQFSVTRSSGHAARTSSWGDTSPATNFGGTAGSITITGDTTTLKLSGFVT